MNRHLGDVPAAHGRRLVRVERKIRRRTAEEVRGLGVTAVGDGLFRMGGALSGGDMLRILTAPKGVRSGKGQIGLAPARKPSAIKAPVGDPVPSKEAPISSSRITREKASAGEGLTPISTPEKGSGFAPPTASSGALADDVCRHIWAGWFGKPLWGTGL